jgi:hypothetical protein
MNKGKTNPSVLPPSSHGGLGNPALIAVASVIPWGFIIKTLFVLGIGYFAYTKWTNRFVKRKYNSNYPDSNISDAQAEARANSIADSIKWFSNDYDNVELQLSGLNYNGFIKLYNAFGNRHIIGRRT